MKPRALFALSPDMYRTIYDGYPRALLDERVEVIGGPLPPDEVRHFPRLHEVEVVFGGWGSPRFDADLLNAMPALRAIFYGAGSIRHLITEDFWARQLPITSAFAANAIPVAEFTHAAILLSLKRVWHYMRAAQRERTKSAFVHMPGAFRSTVGLVSLGAIGRLVAERLKTSDLQVIAYDPFVKPATAAELGIRLVSLEDVFRHSDLVSLHTPLLKETEGLITGALLRTMKPHATLLNTARGALIRESEMIDVLRERPDLTAVLDLTWPDPPVPDSPIFDLPNVFLTPHVAGSMGEECKRMGAYMVEELDRFLRGQPMRWRVTREQFERMA